MATYREIQNWVRSQNGFVPKTCWIAHVLADFGLTARRASNRIDPTNRKYPCPDGRRDSIVAALRYFKMI